MREPLHLQDVFMSRFKTSATQALLTGTGLIFCWMCMKRRSTWGC